MKLLIISLSVGGAMGDNFKVVSKYLQKSNLDISILTNINTGIKSSSNVKVKEISFNRTKPLDFINPQSYFEMVRFIKKGKFDAFLFLSFHPANIFLFKILPQKKIIFYLHDHEPHSGFPKFDKFFFKKQYDFLYSKDVILITSSYFMRNSIISKYPKINKNNIKVIYLGLLDNLIFNSSVVEDEDIDVLFFGRIEYYKGLDILVNSYNNFKNNYSCMIVGKGNLDIFGIQKLPYNFTHINRYVSDEELSNYIKRSKIVVMPYRDATGTQIIQSVFYYGKPIVATNVGCFQEYISHGVDSIIVESENEKQLNDAILNLLEDEFQRKRLGANAQQKLDTLFSNEALNQKYLDILKDINIL